MHLSKRRSAPHEFLFPRDRLSPRTRRLRAVLADPDPTDCDRLRQLLEDEQGIQVLAQCPAGEEAAQAVRRERPELLFLEVTLPDCDGFQLARRSYSYLRCGAIFVSHTDHCAMQAFGVHALDFLLKPVAGDRLHEAVSHVRALLGGTRRDSGAQERLVALLDQRDAERQRRARLLIRGPDGAFFLRTEAIDWVEAAGKQVKLHAGKRVHTQREALARIEAQLDSDQFIRVSRSAIVNIDRIREIQPWFNGEYLVILDDGAQVRSSRRYRVNLRRLFGK